MNSVRLRLRRAIEHVLPWFDRDREERWKAGFERELATSRTIRAHADREIARHDRRTGWSIRDIPRRYERYDDVVRKP